MSQITLQKSINNCKKNRKFHKKFEIINIRCVQGYEKYRTNTIFSQKNLIIFRESINMFRSKNFKKSCFLLNFYEKLNIYKIYLVKLIHNDYYFCLKINKNISKKLCIQTVYFKFTTLSWNLRLWTALRIPPLKDLSRNYALFVIWKLLRHNSKFCI